MKTMKVLLLTEAIPEDRARRLRGALKKGIAGVKVRQVGRLSVGEPIPLTPRQVQVLREIAVGSSVKEVAARMGISAKTVETHRAQVMARLGILRIPQLLRYAIQVGILPVTWITARS